MHSLETEIDCYRGWVRRPDADEPALNYSFEDNLAKVNAFKATGIQVGLLFGRCPEEGLYNETETATQKWAYCCDNTTGCTDDDIMFLIDFMDVCYLKCLPGQTFSHIIFDLGVAKDMEQTGGGDNYDVFREYYRILAPGGVLSLDQSGMSGYQLHQGPSEYGFDESQCYNRCITGKINYRDTRVPGFEELMEHIAEVTGTPTEQLYTYNNASCSLCDDFPDMTSYPCPLIIIHNMHKKELVSEQVYHDIVLRVLVWHNSKPKSPSDLLFHSVYLQLVEKTVDNLRSIGFQTKYTSGRPWGNQVNGDYYHCMRSF